MKSTLYTIIIVLLLLINMNRLQAQKIETNLDQVELMKKFIGTWEGKFGENSLFVCENKQFANGLISFSHITTNGETVESVAQLYGYDSRIDKFIIAELKESSSVIEICSTWFTSTNTGKIIITNPDNAPYQFTFEFKSPDIIEQTAIQDNNVVNSIILERVKD